ncbi:hypothetical protein GCM10025780_37750 [Frondihabitans cladoniiphilus]|uniref:Protein NO VEIN C-terminal domain-containing protein n=2 Tax=Frondihabitans cladoniiphilus TaxID=715785 RepID=A0ABP8WDA0_9MICO
MAHLPSAGVPRTRALLAGLSQYSDLTPTQYEESLSWLQRSQLFDLGGRQTRLVTNSEQLLEATLLLDSPAWFADADVLIQDETELPEDVLAAGKALGLDEVTTYSVIRRVWGKVDTELRRQIGDAGEEALLELLRQSVSARVDHVAAESDGYGYDISVTTDDFQCHLEVKATTRLNRSTFHLSRNEFETMKRDADWCLVLVTLDRDLKLIGPIRAISRPWIQRTAPTDTSWESKWEAARFNVPSEEQIPGIQQLRVVIGDASSPLITGRIV